MSLATLTKSLVRDLMRIIITSQTLNKSLVRGLISATAKFLDHLTNLSIMVPFSKIYLISWFNTKHSYHELTWTAYSWLLSRIYISQVVFRLFYISLNFIWYQQSHNHITLVNTLTFGTSYTNEYLSKFWQNHFIRHRLLVLQQQHL